MLINDMQRFVFSYQRLGPVARRKSSPETNLNESRNSYPRCKFCQM